LGSDAEPTVNGGKGERGRKTNEGGSEATNETAFDVVKQKIDRSKKRERMRRTKEEKAR